MTEHPKAISQGNIGLLQKHLSQTETHKAEKEALSRSGLQLKLKGNGNSNGKRTYDSPTEVAPEVSERQEANI